MAEDIDALIRRAARAWNINEKIFRAQLEAESGPNLDPNAVSRAGAQGIAQFIPSTAAAYGVNLHDGKSADDIDGAAHYMADNLKRTGGNYTQALSIYNSGRPDGYKNIAETSAYVKKIMGAAGAGSSPTTVAQAPGVTSSTQQKTIPGKSYQGDRSAAVATFLQARRTGDKRKALLGLATSLAGIPQDVPDRTVTNTKLSPGAITGGSEAPRADGGVVTDPSGKKVASWIEPILEYARQHGWQGGINSGYRSFEDQTRIYNSGVRPAARPGTSNHEGSQYPRGAIDVSNAEQLSQILAKSKYRKKLVWAGAKDPVHFSHPHNGSY